MGSSAAGLLRVGLLVGAALLSAACVGADVREKGAEAPEWLLNPPKKGGHLYAAGSAEIIAGEAEAMERARDQARLAIVRLFAEVEVSGSLESRERLSSREGVERYSSEVESLARSRVKPIKLRNVEFIEQYSDGRQLSVLADLNLTRERMQLAQRRDELDLELAKTARRLANTSTRPDIHEIRRLSPSLVSMHERAELQARINALAPGMREPLLNDQQKRLREQLLQRVAALRVTVQARSRPDPVLQRGLSQRLSERGMRLGGEGGDLRVLYDLSFERRERGDSVLVTTRGQVSIEDGDGRVIASFSARARGGSTDPASARARSLDRLAEKLGEELIAVLLPFE